MVLSFDVVDQAIPEHDEWHTHEHLPERLSIPGFLRGTRWIAVDGGPRYLVIYEVERLETLSSQAYLQRLDNPSPWTSRMMPHYRGMKRGLCTVAGSCGSGMGHLGLLIRLMPAPDAQSSLRAKLADVMQEIPARRGLGSVHLLEEALPAQMTAEQRMRGADAGLGWAMLVTGYGREALQALAQADLSTANLRERGAAHAVSGLYRTDYMLTAGEVA
jgi:hypothetical protein